MDKTFSERRGRESDNVVRRFFEKDGEKREREMKGGQKCLERIVDQKMVREKEVLGSVFGLWFVAGASQSNSERRLFPM